MMARSIVSRNTFLRRSSIVLLFVPTLLVLIVLSVAISTIEDYGKLRLAAKRAW